MAFKQGGSEIQHLDFGDFQNLLAIIIVLGDFNGGDFKLPQAKVSIPLPSGTVLMVAARDLIHSTGPFEGNRLVITGFIDKNTALHAGIREPEFKQLSFEEYKIWLRDVYVPKTLNRM